VSQIAVDLIPRLVNHIDHLASALAEALDAWEGWASERVPYYANDRITELRRLVNLPK
jgi:hypothetical protein